MNEFDQQLQQLLGQAYEHAKGGGGEEEMADVPEVKEGKRVYQEIDDEEEPIDIGGAIKGEDEDVEMITTTGDGEWEFHDKKKKDGEEEGEAGEKVRVLLDEEVEQEKKEKKSKKEEKEKTSKKKKPLDITEDDPEEDRTVTNEDKINLKPHQLMNVQRIVGQFEEKGLVNYQEGLTPPSGFCLADEMGLGKTLSALVSTLKIARVMIANDPNYRFRWLFLVPVSSITQWKNEFVRWRKSVKSHAKNGTAEQKEEAKFIKTVWLGVYRGSDRDEMGSIFMADTYKGKDGQEIPDLRPKILITSTQTIISGDYGQIQESLQRKKENQEAKNATKQGKAELDRIRGKEESKLFYQKSAEDFVGLLLKRGVLDAHNRQFFRQEGEDINVWRTRVHKEVSKLRQLTAEEKKQFEGDGEQEKKAKQAKRKALNDKLVKFVDEWFYVSKELEKKEAQRKKEEQDEYDKDTKMWIIDRIRTFVSQHKGKQGKKLSELNATELFRLFWACVANNPDKIAKEGEEKKSRIGLWKAKLTGRTIDEAHTLRNAIQDKEQVKGIVLEKKDMRVFKKRDPVYKQIFIPKFATSHYTIRAPFTLCLTGTPIFMNEANMLSLFELAAIPYPENASVNELIEIFKKNSSRTEAEDVADSLPDVTYHTVRLRYDPSLNTVAEEASTEPIEETFHDFWMQTYGTSEMKAKDVVALRQRAETKLKAAQTGDEKVEIKADGMIVEDVTLKNYNPQTAHLSFDEARRILQMDKEREVEMENQHFKTAGDLKVEIDQLAAQYKNCRSRVKKMDLQMQLQAAKTKGQIYDVAHRTSAEQIEALQREEVAHIKKLQQDRNIEVERAMVLERELGEKEEKAHLLDAAGVLQLDDLAKAMGHEFDRKEQKKKSVPFQVWENNSKFKYFLHGILRRALQEENDPEKRAQRGNRNIRIVVTSRYLTLLNFMKEAIESLDISDFKWGEGGKPLQEKVEDEDGKKKWRPIKKLNCVIYDGSMDAKDKDLAKGRLVGMSRKEFYRIKGAKSPADYPKYEEEYKQMGKARIFLLSKAAGATALNLNADTMVLWEMDTNYETDNQVKSRIVRMEQHHKVKIIRLMYGFMDARTFKEQFKRLLKACAFLPGRSKQIFNVMHRNIERELTLYKTLLDQEQLKKAIAAAAEEKKEGAKERDKKEKKAAKRELNEDDANFVVDDDNLVDELGLGEEEYDPLDVLPIEGGEGGAKKARKKGGGGFGGGGGEEREGKGKKRRRHGGGGGGGGDGEGEGEGEVQLDEEEKERGKKNKKSKLEKVWTREELINSPSARIGEYVKWKWPSELNNKVKLRYKGIITTKRLATRKGLGQVLEVEVRKWTHRGVETLYANVPTSKLRFIDPMEDSAIQGRVLYRQYGGLNIPPEIDPENLRPAGTKLKFRRLKLKDDQKVFFNLGPQLTEEEKKAIEQKKIDKANEAEFTKALRQEVEGTEIKSKKKAKELQGKKVEDEKKREHQEPELIDLSKEDVDIQRHILESFNMGGGGGGGTKRKVEDWEEELKGFLAKKAKTASSTVPVAIPNLKEHKKQTGKERVNEFLDQELWRSMREQEEKEEEERQIFARQQKEKKKKEEEERKKQVAVASSSSSSSSYSVPAKPALAKPAVAKPAIAKPNVAVAEGLMKDVFKKVEMDRENDRRKKMEALEKKMKEERDRKMQQERDKKTEAKESEKQEKNDKLEKKEEEKDDEDDDDDDDVHIPLTQLVAPKVNDKKKEDPHEMVRKAAAQIMQSKEDKRAQILTAPGQFAILRYSYPIIHDKVSNSVEPGKGHGEKLASKAKLQSDLLLKNRQQQLKTLASVRNDDSLNYRSFLSPFYDENSSIRNRDFTLKENALVLSGIQWRHPDTKEMLSFATELHLLLWAECFKTATFLADMLVLKPTKKEAKTHQLAPIRYDPFIAYHAVRHGKLYESRDSMLKRLAAAGNTRPITDDMREVRQKLDKFKTDDGYLKNVAKLGDYGVESNDKKNACVGWTMRKLMRKQKYLTYILAKTSLILTDSCILSFVPFMASEDQEEIDDELMDIRTFLIQAMDINPVSWKPNLSMRAPPPPPAQAQPLSKPLVKPLVSPSPSVSKSTMPPPAPKTKPAKETEKKKVEKKAPATKAQQPKKKGPLE